MNPLLTGSKTTVFVNLVTGNRYAVRGRVCRATYYWLERRGSTTAAFVFDTNEQAFSYAAGHTTAWTR